MFINNNCQLENKRPFVAFCALLNCIIFGDISLGNLLLIKQFRQQTLMKLLKCDNKFDYFFVFLNCYLKQRHLILQVCQFYVKTQFQVNVRSCQPCHFGLQGRHFSPCWQVLQNLYSVSWWRWSLLHNIRFQQRLPVNPLTRTYSSHSKWARTVKRLSFIGQATIVQHVGKTNTFHL